MSVEKLGTGHMGEREKRTEGKGSLHPLARPFSNAIDIKGKLRKFAVSSLLSSVKSVRFPGGTPRTVALLRAAISKCEIQKSGFAESIIRTFVGVALLVSFKPCAFRLVKKDCRSVARARSKTFIGGLLIVRRVMGPVWLTRRVL